MRNDMLAHATPTYSSSYKVARMPYNRSPKALSTGNAAPMLSEKYKGIISREEQNQLHSHVQQMRSEWSSI